MSNKLLKKISTVAPKVQGKQILDSLQKKKNKGEIESVAELKKQLNELTSELLSQRITPSLKLMLGEGGEQISSEVHNFMLERIQTDLEVGFQEAFNLEQLISIHAEIINNNVIKGLQYAINELDERISLLEFINSNKTGLHNGQVNRFNTAKNLSTPRDHELSKVLYKGIPPVSDAVVDVEAGELELPITSSREIPIASVRHITDKFTDASELDVSLEGTNDPNRIKEQDLTGYWSYVTLLENRQKLGALQKLEFHFGNNRDINRLRLEPLADHPMTIESANYIDINGTSKSLPISNVILDRTRTLVFPRVNARKIILHLRQHNYDEVFFEKRIRVPDYRDRKKKWDSAKESVPVVSNRASANGGVSVGPVPTVSEEAAQTETANGTETSGGHGNNNLRKVLKNNPRAAEVILGDSALEFPGTGGPTGTRTKVIKIKYYQYVFGLISAKAFQNTYGTTGIFVSKPLKVDKLGQIALKRKESRAAGQLPDLTIEQNPDDDDDKFYHGSVEYSVVTENFNKDGKFLFAKSMPILPLGTNKVLHERLFLTNSVDGSSKKNAGFLRFYPDDSKDIKVYRNGVLLTENTDWLRNSSTNALDQDDPTVRDTMRVALKIINPRVTDVYTVSYTPKLSNSINLPKDFNSSVDIVSLGDKSRDRVGPNNIIFTDLDRGASGKIAKTNIYLIIVLRRNSALVEYTPSVDEYFLMGGTGQQNQ